MQAEVAYENKRTKDRLSIVLPSALKMLTGS